MKLKKLSILILIAASTMGIKGCPDNAPAWKWNPEIWAGDSQTQSITRQKKGELVVIPTSDPSFDEMVCVHKSEPRKAKEAYFEVINKCKVWDSKTDYERALEFVDSEMMNLLGVQQ